MVKQKHTESQCLRNYGFVANPNTSLQKNFNTTLRNLPIIAPKQPSNLTFHNLCTDTEIPLGTRQLLGLNLKFCLSPKIIPNNINTTVLQTAYTIRTATFLNESTSNTDSAYIKQIYIKNKQWNPPPASATLEEKITAFEKTLRNKQNQIFYKNEGKTLSNLTYTQLTALRNLKNNKNLIIKPSDKNLGPVILDTKAYTLQVLNEHLLTNDYRQLTPDNAKHKMEDIKTYLKKLIHDNQSNLPKEEYTYFQRSFKEFHRTPIFYGLPKIHKQPMTLRPVVSCSGSFLSIFSVWLDYKMKLLLPLVQSFIKNSNSLINDLKSLDIPPDALLFTADATSMYTNIDTHTGISAVRDFISTHLNAIPSNFPTNLFLQILFVVMENNIFSFADTYWQQLTGTAMGTPVACSYATVSFGHYENATILPAFSSNLLYYRRYIDDVFGIWIPSSYNHSNTWETFKTTLNNWGSLKWKIQEPTKNTIFLDLNIQLKGKKIHTSTYQKPMNLYLYIPPLSAHPPGCFKGLIAGELKRYWIQNSPADFKRILVKFITRLIERGHSLQSLIPLLKNAAANLNKNTPTTKADVPDKTLFIHWKYHPHGLQNNDIRQAFDNTLKGFIPFNQMRIALSRQKNLRDILTRAALTLPENLKIQDLLDQAKSD